MRKALLALMIAALGAPAFAQSFGGSSDSMSSGMNDTSAVNDGADYNAPDNRTDSDQPLEQSPNGNLTGKTGLDTYEQVPGSGLSGAQNQSGTDFNSTLPDLGTPSPGTPSTAEGPSSNTGPTLPDTEQNQNPAPDFGEQKQSPNTTPVPNP